MLCYVISNQDNVLTPLSSSKMLLPAHSAQDQVLLLGGRLPCRVRLPRDWCSRRLVVAQVARELLLPTRGELDRTLAKLYHRLSKQYGRIFRANKLDQKIKIILVSWF